MSLEGLGPMVVVIYDVGDQKKAGHRKNANHCPLVSLDFLLLYEAKGKEKEKSTQ